MIRNRLSGIVYQKGRPDIDPGSEDIDEGTVVGIFRDERFICGSKCSYSQDI